VLHAASPATPRTGHHRCRSNAPLNAPPLETRAVPNPHPTPAARPANAAAGNVDDVPFEPQARRLRIRRGGPRTPLPLLPVIAIAAGVGIAYVNQTAHVTTATYQATRLAATQQQLAAQAGQLNNELAQLESSERIIAAAQHLGMHPAARWAFVVSGPSHVITSPPDDELTSSKSGSTLEQLVAGLVGAFGGDTAAR